MKREELLSALDRSTEELIQAMQQFTQEQFNTVPFTGSWTAGQVAEHLFKAESGIPSVIEGNTAAAERPEDEKIPEIEGVFLDFNSKFQSPLEIMPTDEEKDKNMYINRFISIRKELRLLAEKSDLSLLCLDFQFPGSGELTRLEWLWFVRCHAVRHTRQINNIYQKLA